VPQPGTHHPIQVDQVVYRRAQGFHPRWVRKSRVYMKNKP